MLFVSPARVDVGATAVVADARVGDTLGAREGIAAGIDGLGDGEASANVVGLGARGAIDVGAKVGAGGSAGVGAAWHAAVPMSAINNSIDFGIWSVSSSMTR